MDISLTKPELEAFVREQVNSGHFSSASELVEAAVARLMLEPATDALDDDTVEAIRRAEAEFERGEDRPFGEVAAELRKKYLDR